MGKAVGFALLSSALLEIEEINDLYAFLFFSVCSTKKPLSKQKKTCRSREERGKAPEKR